MMSIYISFVNGFLFLIYFVVLFIYIYTCSNDSKVDESDLMKGFDDDGDGKLDASELKRIADQLNSQLEYNNSLLEQLRISEEQQLECQRELSTKQNMIKRLSMSVEESKNEATELKRKLKVTEEIANTMSQQAREARLEMASVKKDAENAIKNSNDSKGMLKDVMDERSRLHRALTQTQNALNQAKDDLDHEKNELANQNNMLRQSHEALVNENAELRAKVIPIESEKKTLRDNIQQLTRTLEEVTARCDLEVKNRTVMEKKMKEMTNTIDGLREKHKEMTFVIQQATGKADAASVAVNASEAQVKSMEAHIKELDNEITDLNRQLKNEKLESASIEEEISHLGAELLVQTKQREQDQKRWAERLEMAQKEMLASAEEAKAQAEEFALDAQRRAAESIESRKRAEEKYLNIQVECSELHTLIQEAQETHQQALEDWQQQHEELEGVISDLERRNALAEDEIDNMHSLLVAEREQHAETIQTLKQELYARGERYVAMLGTLQTALSRIKLDASTNREKVRETVAQFTVVRAFADQIWGNIHPPLEGWKAELSLVHKGLIVKCKVARDNVENHKDDIRRLALAKEEERSKTLMLEEAVSRLEHEISSYDQKIIDADTKANQKVVLMRDKVDQMTSEKQEMEGRIQRLQQSLDAQVAQSRQLQSSNQSIQNNLGASTAKQTAAKSEIQGKISQLSSQLKRANQERDANERLAGETQAKYIALQDEFDAMKTAMETAKAEAMRYTFK